MKKLFLIALCASLTATVSAQVYGTGTYPVPNTPNPPSTTNNPPLGSGCTNLQPCRPGSGGGGTWSDPRPIRPPVWHDPCQGIDPGFNPQCWKRRG